MNRAHVIVVGNEKGGSGKTTTAMHLIAALMKIGLRVGSVDLDSRQRSLTRYVENRREWSTRNGVKLPMPEHVHVPPGSEEAEKSSLESALSELSFEVDAIVVDGPGSDTPLSRAGHAFADTLVTPLNDSFVDFDVLGRVDPETYEVVSPSHYSEMVWQMRKERAVRDGGSIDWVVMRNRLSQLDAKNKRRVERGIDALSRRIGFRIAPGFGERVIFRELFPSGLTVLDYKDDAPSMRMAMSHVAARAEVRALLDAIGLETQAPARASA